jgi:hypothetical protein
MGWRAVDTGVIMKIRHAGALLVLTTVGFVGAEAQEEAPGEVVEARLWMDRGEEPLLQRGDRVRLYYRTSEDAFVAIFHIDTDGVVQLLHPRAPDEDHFVRAARDYRLLFPQSSYWYVDEYPGKGYFFMVASPVPFDFGELDYARYDRGWDLTPVGRTVYEDPFLAMDEYVATLIPDWEVVPYGLDFISYDVGEHYEYPRFLCYDCHGFRSYSTWNPYTYVCATYRVVIWDDPYFYPAYRYGGTRVVFTQPRRGVPRFEFKERATGEPWSPLVRTRQPPLRRPVTYVEPSVATPRTEYVPPRRPRTPSRPTPSVSPTRPSRSGTGLQAPPRRTTAGTTPAQPGVRRPTTASGPVTTPGAARRPTSGLTRPGTGSGDRRPVLTRRPATSRAGGDRSSPTVRRPTPSATRGGGTRAVVPGRPSASRPSTSRARPTPSRPSARPATARPSSGSRPTVRARPPARGKPTRSPPRRKPGG